MWLGDVVMCCEQVRDHSYIVIVLVRAVGAKWRGDMSFDMLQIYKYDLNIIRIYNNALHYHIAHHVRIMIIGIRVQFTNIYWE